MAAMVKTRVSCKKIELDSTVKSVNNFFVFTYILGLLYIFENGRARLFQRSWL